MKAKRGPITSLAIVDRTEALDSFMAAYQVLAGKEDELDIFNVYGVEGIGKSAFIDKVKHCLDENEIEYASYDYRDGNNPVQIIIRLKNQLSKRQGFSFPELNFAIAMYAHKSGTDYLSQEAKEMLLKDSPWLNTLFSITSAVSIEAAVGTAIAQAVLGSKEFIDSIKNASDRVKFEESFKKIEEMTENEIVKRLAYYFSEDLSRNMKNKSKNLVLILDSYEESIQFNTPEYLPEDWLTGENGILKRCARVMWLIASRERIQWEKCGIKELGLFELNELELDYAKEYLNNFEVDNEKQLEILAKTRNPRKMRDYALGGININDSVNTFTSNGVTCFGDIDYSSVFGIVAILACINVWNDYEEKKLASEYFGVENISNNKIVESCIERGMYNNKISRGYADLILEMLNDDQADGCYEVVMGVFNDEISQLYNTEDKIEVWNKMSNCLTAWLVRNISDGAIEKLNHFIDITYELMRFLGAEYVVDTFEKIKNLIECTNYGHIKFKVYQLLQRCDIVLGDDCNASNYNNLAYDYSISRQEKFELANDTILRYIRENKPYKALDYGSATISQEIEELGNDHETTLVGKTYLCFVYFCICSLKKIDEPKMMADKCVQYAKEVLNSPNKRIDSGIKATCVSTLVKMLFLSNNILFYNLRMVNDTNKIKLKGGLEKPVANLKQIVDIHKKYINEIESGICDELDMNYITMEQVVANSYFLMGQWGKGMAILQKMKSELLKHPEFQQYHKDEMLRIDDLMKMGKNGEFFYV